MASKYTYLAQIGSDLKNGHLEGDEAINHSWELGVKSRDVEVSNLRGQIKYLEEDKHPKEIAELLKVMENLPKWLRESATSMENSASRNGAYSTLAPKLNWYADKMDTIISKYTKS